MKDIHFCGSLCIFPLLPFVRERSFVISHFGGFNKVRNRCNIRSKHFPSFVKTLTDLIIQSAGGEESKIKSTSNEFHN